MSRVAVLASYAPSLVKFRGHLLRTLVERAHTVVALAPGIDEKTEAWLRAAGVEPRAIHLHRTKISLRSDFQTLGELIAIFRRTLPDVLLSYTAKPVIYGSLAAKWAGVPRVCSIITGLGFAFSGKSVRQLLLRGILTELYRVSLRANEVVFFQNQDDLDLFRRKKLLSTGTKAVLVNGSGVDIEFFYQAPPRTDPIVFLLIARLLKEKGIREYVEAARRLRVRYPEARFWVLGPLDPNPGGISEREVRTWMEDQVIEYLGQVEDVRPYIEAASVYVLPSYREGTPRSVLEAMAMGRPIITSDAPGCRETVEDGVNGFLVPPRDAAALALAMERFILDRSLIVQMGQASRRMAEAKYDVRKVTAVMLDAMGLGGETGC